MVGIHPCKGEVLLAGFEFLHQVRHDRAVHEQHLVSLFPGCLDVGMLCLFIRCIQRYELAILVGLLLFHFVLKLFERVVGTVYGWIQRKGFCLFEEFVFGKHAVFDDDFDIVPLLLEIFPVFLKEGIQLVGYLPGDVGSDFFHCPIRLQV